MLKKRVIFTLLYDSGYFMLSRNFRLQKVGDLQWLKKNYNFSHIAFSIDELIILDVTRGERNEEEFLKHVRLLNEECFIPIAAGGGIRTVEQARKLLHSGADKIVLNTLVIENSNIIIEIAKESGQQSIVASIDVRLTDGGFTIWTDNGSVEHNINLSKLLEGVEKMPIGEVYLNSLDRDGTGHGYQFELIEQIPDLFPMPVILAGGAGKCEHFSKGLNDVRVDAVATANLFNFVGDGLYKARQNLLNHGFYLASWQPELAINLKKELL